MANSESNKRDFCILPWHSVSIDSRGKVVPCCFNSTKMGDIRTDSFESIWHGESYQNLRDSFRRDEIPEACRLCEAANIDWSGKYGDLLRLRPSKRLLSALLGRLFGWLRPGH